MSSCRIGDSRRGHGREGLAGVLRGHTWPKTGSPLRITHVQSPGLHMSGQSLQVSDLLCTQVPVNYRPIFPRHSDPGTDSCVY